MKLINCCKCVDSGSKTGITYEPGFSVLEMIISVMISAMLMTASLTIYNQISKGALTIARITQADTQAMIVHNRLVTDLQGLMPLWFTKEHYEQLKETEQGKEAKESSPKTNSSSSKKQNNFLYAQSNNDQFNILTFVSTNALQLYGDQPTRTVRIVYALQPDGETFKLMRKEDNTITSEFDLEKLKSGKFDQLAHKITKCTVEYGFIETDKKKASTEKDTEKPFEFKFVSKWGGITESNTEEHKEPTLPDILKMKLSIQTNSNQDPKTYELYCTIPTSHAPVVSSFAQKRQKEKKEQKPNENSQISSTTQSNITEDSSQLPTSRTLITETSIPGVIP
ncbi:hypothetical protein KBB68_04195 [Candidatus Babeliales bacterium]|nr:hypothetical protein [Candidatus Babeliales bacterium]